MCYVLDNSKIKDVKYLSTINIPKWAFKSIEKNPSHETYHGQGRLICPHDPKNLKVINLDQGPFLATELQNCPHCGQLLGSYIVTNNKNLKYEY